MPNSRGIKERVPNNVHLKKEKCIKVVLQGRGISYTAKSKYRVCNKMNEIHWLVTEATQNTLQFQEAKDMELNMIHLFISYHFLEAMYHHGRKEKLHMMNSIVVTCLPLHRSSKNQTNSYQSLDQKKNDDQCRTQLHLFLNANFYENRFRKTSPHLKISHQKGQNQVANKCMKQCT